jgi:hypothetical protein
VNERIDLVPDPIVSDKQFNRYYHHDLPEFKDEEIWDELNYLRARLWGLDSQHWLRKRVKALETQMRVRQVYTPYKAPNERKSDVVKGVIL